MNNTCKSNLKRIRNFLLSDKIEDNYIANQDSDLENDHDFVSVESHDIFTNKHVSEGVFPP